MKEDQWKVPMVPMSVFHQVASLDVDEDKRTLSTHWRAHDKALKWRGGGDSVTWSRSLMFGLLFILSSLSTADATVLQKKEVHGSPKIQMAMNQKASESRLNINAASLEELCTLPGIGPKRAEQIIEHRSKRPFTRVTQLVQIRGIGWKTLRKLRPLIYIGPSSEKTTVNRKQKEGVIQKNGAFKQKAMGASSVKPKPWPKPKGNPPPEEKCTERKQTP